MYKKVGYTQIKYKRYLGGLINIPYKKLTSILPLQEYIRIYTSILGIIKRSFN